MARWVTARLGSAPEIAMQGMGWLTNPSLFPWTAEIAMQGMRRDEDLLPRKNEIASEILWTVTAAEIAESQ
jgi:hypothetical protein